METIELEFLLKLLEFEAYRAPLSEIKLDPKISETQIEEICRNLCDRGFLACSYEISKFKIASSGKFLLKQDSDNLPLTEEEFKVLQASAKHKITPDETEIPGQQQQTVIQSLADRGLIQVKTKHKKIKEVGLTERAKEYLQYEYDPRGTGSVISVDLLSNYLQFLRNSFQHCLPLSSTKIQTVSDDKILLTIVELERQLATDNRLPIFHLRDKLHPFLSREELDNALSRLEASGEIEMDSLTAKNACVYTAQQIDAGIIKGSGAPLFFIRLK
ncbi:MAG TPA: hypothetical protein V6D50_19195 [Chroococcales cyanobacterium]|jgi:hypothetical protein